MKTKSTRAFTLIDALKGTTSLYKGFTLIELLVVISIIALLLSIVLPSLNRVKETSRKTICASNMRSVATLVTIYAQNNDDFVPPLTDRLGWNRTSNYDNQRSNHYGRWFRIVESTPEQPWSYWNLGFLHKEGMVDTGEIFFCPARQAEFKYEDYTGQGWPTDLQIGATGIRIPYLYNPTTISLTDRHRKFTKLSQFTVGGGPLIVDLLLGMNTDGTGQEVKKPAHQRGWNIAQKDTSIHFVIDPTVVDDLRSSANFNNDDYETFDRVIYKLR